MNQFIVGEMIMEIQPILCPTQLQPISFFSFACCMKLDEKCENIDAKIPLERRQFRLLLALLQEMTELDEC